MTAVEWLEKQLTDAPYIHFGDLFEQAKEMENQMVIDIVEKSRATGLTAEYLLLTYGSKESDEYPEIEGTMAICNDIISSQTEISDKEILDAAEDFSDSYMNRGVAMSSFARGCYWYREQLKNKQ